mmetsp:Transcript_82140/g.207292  ORF Transcript_82140/g.207292 Transcript_82140/m.207292 type:complete len:202 (+) Transcript_82140:404-1009(+)
MAEIHSLLSRFWPDSAMTSFLSGASQSQMLMMVSPRLESENRVETEPSLCILLSFTSASSLAFATTLTASPDAVACSTGASASGRAPFPARLCKRVGKSRASGKRGKRGERSKRSASTAASMAGTNSHFHCSAHHTRPHGVSPMVADATSKSRCMSLLRSPSVSSAGPLDTLGTNRQGSEFAHSHGSHRKWLPPLSGHEPR